MNFWVQVTQFSGDYFYFKWCSELLLCVLLDDRRRSKDVYRFYMSCGHSLAWRMSSSRCTNRLCGRLLRETCLPSDSFCCCEIRESCCCSYKVFSPFGHPWQALSALPFPNRSCAPSTALNILLLLPSPWLTLRKSPQESYWRCQGSACDELELGSLQKGTCITCSVWDISLESAVGTQNSFCMEAMLEKAGSKIQFRMGKPWLNTYWT